MIVSHHTRKEGAADFIDTLSGTFGVAGSADTIAILSRKRGENTGKIQITGRDVEEETYQLTGFPYWRIDGTDLRASAAAAEATAARAALGDRSIQILAMVIAKGDVLTQEVAIGLGITVEQASVYLGRLAKSGRIEKTGRGHWKPSVGSVEIGKSLVPPVETVKSVEKSTESTVSTGDTRACAREARWLTEDGEHNWQAIWEWTQGPGPMPV